ncbi:hypothetical protein [Streptomyces sp. 891-h]|uniref:hypothetical protein n=1 Tax=Streptomyces sp. 891-h TaxID=2720714 RepID=UPI001FA9CC26|nr:hypothetical protein [Streptomyces sp. 891-h]UNZ22309.1 hypothetical protein HC362_34645 [Streptomyces sp. 891-h]
MPTYTADELTMALHASLVTDLPNLSRAEAQAAITEELTGYGLAHARALDAYELGDRPETVFPRRTQAADLVRRYGVDALQPTPITGLTIRQPWAAQLTHRNRRCVHHRWPAQQAGWLLLHASSVLDNRYLPQVRETDPDLPLTTGAVIGAARLVTAHESAGSCCPWGAPDFWHWVITDLHPLKEPVPARGRQCPWDPAPALVREVRAQLPQGVLL